MSVTEGTHFIYDSLNPAFCRLLGFRAKEAYGRPPEECLPQEVAEAVAARYRECVTLGEPIRYLETIERGRGPRHHETTLVPVRDPLGGRTTAIFGHVRDVTQRRRAHREVEGALRLLQSTLDAIAAPITLLDETGMIIAVNRAWRQRHDNGPSARPAWIGRSYLTARTGLKARRGEAAIKADFKALFAGLRDEICVVYQLSDPAAERWVQLRATRFVHAGAERIVVSHEDVTEAVVAKREVNELAERLLFLQEEERRRIASDLHDSTGQHLVAATLSLCRLRPKVAADPAMVEIVDEIGNSLAEAQRELRAFTFLLHPPGLDDEGLRMTLRHLVDGFGRRTGLSTRAVITEAIEGVAFPVQRTILRIVQEALVNVHRHASATSVDVDLARRDGDLVLTIRDDGRCLPQAVRKTEPPRLGVGIAGMRARVADLGGSLDIRMGRRGTTVTAHLPVGEAICA